MQLPSPHTAADEFADAAWRTSSYTQGDQGDCVEVAAKGRLVGVRDSRHRSGPVLAFKRAKFGAFIAELRENSRRIL